MHKLNSFIVFNFVVLVSALSHWAIRLEARTNFSRHKKSQLHRDRPSPKYLNFNKLSRKYFLTYSEGEKRNVATYYDRSKNNVPPYNDEGRRNVSTFYDRGENNFPPYNGDGINSRSTSGDKYTNKFLSNKHTTHATGSLPGDMSTIVHRKSKSGKLFNANNEVARLDPRMARYSNRDDGRNEGPKLLPLTELRKEHKRTSRKKEHRRTSRKKEYKRTSRKKEHKRTSRTKEHKKITSRKKKHKRTSNDLRTNISTSTNRNADHQNIFGAQGELMLLLYIIELYYDGFNCITMYLIVLYNNILHWSDVVKGKAYIKI